MRLHPLILSLVTVSALAAQQPSLGYYRFPALGPDVVIFTAEGDLWRVPIAGGVAQRLTSHPSEESRPSISPDGKTVAFSAAYEGPTEVYTMPIEGGRPVRHTFEGTAALVVGWTPEGRILYNTRRYSTLPNTQLASVDPGTNAFQLIELAQASDGAFDKSGTLFFTRLPFQGSYTKRYEGGTAQNIWKYAKGGTSSTPLTASYAGTSRSPMLWNGRIYFVSDRDGTMNLWSMNESGADLRQHTHHTGFDVQSPSIRDGKVVYQLGADLHLYDLATNADKSIPIRLVSDFEQTRERWLRTPGEWMTAAHLSPTGDRIVITARGQVFVAPARQGRFTNASAEPRVRFRDARFFPDGKSLLTLNDKSGEVEFWRLPANGIGGPTQLTNDAKVLRWDGIPSPDGRYIANYDKDQQLWLYDTQTKKQTLVGMNRDGGYGDVQWSADGKWLAYSVPASNQFSRIYLHDMTSGKDTPVTSDRYDSYNPEWSPDGKWLFFLSDRNLESSVGSPWGARQPEPFFDRQTMVFALALMKGLRSPFQSDDELTLAGGGARDSGRAVGDTTRAPRAASPIVDLDGIERRLVQLPLPAGNYSDLSTDGKRLYFLSYDNSPGSKPQLRTFAIDNKGDAAETFIADLAGYELSADRTKVMVRRSNDLFVFDAGAKAPTDITKSQVNLRDWVIHVDPREEWRQMFLDAWRLERDYFYDHGMNGVSWTDVRDQYAPLVERVSDRAELNDLLAQMVGELSALHIFVRGGDLRRGTEAVLPASLGARLARDEARGGYRVDHIYRSDPDAPRDLAPLAQFGVDVKENDVIESVNGVPTLSVPDIGSLLRDQADKQTLLHVRPADGTASRDVIVMPMTQARETAMRYTEWEYTRRLAVDKAAGGEIGYVHLRAMGGGDIAQWARDFYPVFDRSGLIIDVRHNNGGNIDSWLLEKLLRKAWFYFQPRTGNPTWNMQYAFRGHVVVIADEFTASDGEAFSEGFRRLGLGKVIGTRTWGGEIWLSSSNTLVDRGIATAAEIGVYGPERKWLIEGRGVEPDITIDNEPHAAFLGKDAQLDAAIAFLRDEIMAHPVAVPAPPTYPNKSLKAVLQAGKPKPPLN